MHPFLLPYIVQGQPFARLFARVNGIDIVQAAEKACRQLRAEYEKRLGHPVMVAVAEVDFTWRNRETGELLPRAQPNPIRKRRNRRRGW